VREFTSTPGALDFLEWSAAPFSQHTPFARCRNARASQSPNSTRCELRLIKIAARAVEMKTQIRLHLPTSCPDQRILRIVLDRIPWLVT
jgi:hypothetical protein